MYQPPESLHPPLRLSFLIPCISGRCVHEKEVFVNATEIVAVATQPYARSPRHSPRKERSSTSYFYLPLLTLIHTCFSSSAHRPLLCRWRLCALLHSNQDLLFPSVRCCSLSLSPLRESHLPLPSQPRELPHKSFKLASLRRTQTMANDTATTRLLYAILSQKCLKDVCSHLFPFVPSLTPIFQPPSINRTIFIDRLEQSRP